MSTDAADIFAAALTLPDSQRADLAFQLLGTLRPPAMFSEDEPRFVAELERRCASFETGDTSAATIDEVTDRVRTAVNHSEGMSAISRG